MKKFILALDEVYILIEYLKTSISQNAIIFLDGDLASGKTTLVKNILKDYSISSPTFSIQKCYGELYFHYDFYNTTFQEFYNIGLIEEFEKNGWHFIEWGDKKLKKFLLEAGYSIFSIKISFFEKKRKYIFYKGISDENKL